MDENLYRPLKLTPKRDRLRSAKRRYLVSGGQITLVPPPDNDHPRPSDVSQCNQCEDWHNGKGSQKCITCGTYKRFQVKNSPRSQIPIDIMPAILLEAIEDLSDDYDILRAIQRLPDDLAAIISMRYVAGLSTRSVAGIMRISEPSVRRREQVGLTQIKKMFSCENTDLKKNRDV
jgi:DNA-directed RNA polymerase specialized sigma24 family protein